jgi:hypothetical protein
VAAPHTITLPSLDVADHCELQIGLTPGQAVWVALTDGMVSFRGEMGSIDPLWAVLNGSKAAARSNRVLLGLAREGSEIDVVAYERGKGVQLASRVPSIGFSDLLRQIEAARIARLAETAHVKIPFFTANRR